MKNKGYVVILDAIIALIFLLFIFTIFIAVYEPKVSKTGTTSFKNIHYLSEDVLDVLNKQGVLDEIGAEWASANGSVTSEHWSNATNISKKYLEKLIPKRFGYRLVIDDTNVIYDSNSDPDSERPPEDKASSETHSTRLLVGYGKGLPTRGHVARAFLTNIREKTTSKYVYFGGFVGQGNLTRILTLPNCTVQRAYIEVATGSEFELYINDVSAGVFTPTVWNMTANIKSYIPNPETYFNPGDNKIEIIFTGDDISEQYIGGGFIKVTYNTSKMDTAQETGTSRYWFPGIEGLINLYSSFYVPGSLNSMNIHLKFFNNYTTYLTIGDQEVFSSSGSSVNQTYDLDDSNLTMLNYAGLSMETIPIRLGIRNVSYLANVTGNADVILITDLSGSMAQCVENNSNCPAGDQRIDLAKRLDEEFVDIVLNGTGNRVGLVGYRSGIASFHSLSDNNLSLKTQINGYWADGGTCICCAINKAYELLSSSNASRQKFIVVMTDGIPSHKCGGYSSPSACDGNSSSSSFEGDCYGCTYCCPANPYTGNGCLLENQLCGKVWNCWGWWPNAWCECSSLAFNGYVTGGGWTIHCTAYDCSVACQCQCEMQNANWSSCRAHNDLNATVYSIGFGPVANCPMGNWTLRAIADCGNGSYYASSNASELELIYRTIAQDIVNVSYRAQTARITGNITPSILYPESYIEFSYTPAINATAYGEITLTQDTERFNDTENCTGILFVPEIARVVDAKVTSYSAEYWTDYLNVSNSHGSTIAYTLRDGHFGIDYRILGDPYIVQIPNPSVNLIPGENNSLEIRTSNSPTEDMGCSPDDRAIYTIRLSGRIGYGNVFLKKSGCNWTIRFEDDTNITESIPDYYNGDKKCYYTPENISYDENDAIDDAIFRLLQRLDSNKNRKIDIKFDSSMIEFDFSRAGGVRSLWGPITMKLIVWM